MYKFSPVLSLNRYLPVRLRVPRLLIKKWADAEDGVFRRLNFREIFKNISTIVDIFFCLRYNSGYGG